MKPPSYTEQHAVSCTESSHLHARVHQECTKTSASRPRLVPHSGALYALFLYPLSMHFVQGVLKIGNDSNYRAVPKHRSACRLDTESLRPNRTLFEYSNPVSAAAEFGL